MPRVAIIPRPARVEHREGEFTLSPDTALLVDETAPDGLATATLLADWLAAETGVRLQPQLASPQLPPANFILLTARKASNDFGEEGYTLRVTPQSVTLRATKPAGLFYAAQTFRQLVLPAARTILAVEIHDKPRFGWRGMMLDEARHFFGKEFVKRFIDLLAFHKFNVFHWHLTDDQGWRIEIKEYPKLTEVGAWRAASPREGNRNLGDGQRYGGFCTQDDIRELVTYAAARHINIVPEIEMPGHASAAIASYPQFGNADGPGYQPVVQTRWSILSYTFAPTEETFRFLEDVLSEVMALFPSRYIHVGGDEVPKDPWKQSPTAQSVMREHGLRDEHELQSHFVRRIEQFLNANGRRLIGWDEIQEGGLSPTATMMVWRDWKWAAHAIERGNDVVMAPRTHTYFDYYQRDPKTHSEPEAIGGLITLEKVHSFDPIPPGVAPAQRNHILGAQGQLWSEYLFDANKVEYMAFPRACALAEVVWSPPEPRDFTEFRQRLAPHMQRLARMNVHACPLD